MSRLLEVGILGVIFGLAATAPVRGDEGRVSFSRDVRPILSNRCFKCHGFDPATREADLRLDTQAGLFSDHDGHTPFVASQVGKSEAIRRILSPDDDERMPPPSAKKDLTPREKEILRKWVEQGTPWEPHWAYVKPQRPAVPEMKDDAWPRNAVDHFVKQRLSEAGLSPAAEADRYTLIRRVSLDLTGLPPTPEEADAFVNDTSPDAYERLVDRLLNSPAYGERWARRWLDLARYADTNGYEKDRERSIWPWRDWVVKALNNNMPFDEFTIKQIAGDMLPDATDDDRIATGFHRNTMLNEEGGIDPLEFRYHAMTDRVATTGTTWLGLTTGCAQCHDHKFDPISHREYFGMMAFLNNADEVELPLGGASKDASQQLEDWNRFNDERTAIQKLAEEWPVSKDAPEATPAELAAAAFHKWLDAERAGSVPWTVLVPTKLSSNLPLLRMEDRATIFVTGDITKQDRYEISGKPDLRKVTAIQLEALPDARLPDGGPGLTYYEGTKGDFFLTEFRPFANGQPIPIAKAIESYAKNRFGANAATAAMAIDGDPQTGWSVAGRSGERHAAVFTLAEPTDIDEFDLEMTFGRHYATSLGKFRISFTTGENAPARDLPEHIETLLRKADKDLSDSDRVDLRQAFYQQAPEVAKQVTAIRAKYKQPPVVATPVFQERPANNPRPTYLHHRGEWLQAKEEVPAVTLAFLNPLPEGAPKNRLTFARWLVSKDNPLTARVVVNQHWAALFGRGIVSTVQDFGFQGDPPSHPQLLDWLALEFIDCGWNLKHMHRLMVTSSTYRQSSIATPTVKQADPSNVLLSRGPRLRLEAEIIRDSALAASGLLSRKVGGPPVKPPQPNSVTEAAYGAFKWEPSTGEDRYRRSLYTFMKRTAPFAMFTTFDGPSGEACLARRDVSNTALQGLALLNDEMYLEISRALGQRVLACEGDDRAKAAHLFRLVLTRPADEDELNDLVSFVSAQRITFKEHPEDAKAFTGSKDDNAPELAAWVALSRAVLSLDETITRN